MMAIIGYVIIITVATEEFGRPYGGIEVHRYKNLKKYRVSALITCISDMCF